MVDVTYSKTNTQTMIAMTRPKSERRMSAGYIPKHEKLGLEDLFRGLVTASHNAYFGGTMKSKVDVEGGGKIKQGKLI